MDHNYSSANLTIVVVKYSKYLGKITGDFNARKCERRKNVHFAKAYLFIVMVLHKVLMLVKRFITTSIR